MERRISRGLALFFCASLVACIGQDAPTRGKGAGGSTGRLQRGLSKGAAPLAACGSVTYEGCCSGQTLYFCDAGALQVYDCTSSPSCGWDSTNNWYNCGTSGTADPSGTYPMTCTLPADSGPKPDTKPVADSGTCGPITYEGCCSGQTLYFCYSGALYTSDCTSSPSCGWDSTNNYYDCGTSGTADPSGTYPMSCGLPDSGTKPDQSVKPDSGIPCGAVSNEGCCTGQTLYYCESGSLQSLDCTSNPSCGWDSTNNWYNCGTSGTADPSGTYPMSCSGAADAGAKPDKKIAPPDSKPPSPDTSNCGKVTAEGCCDGQILYYCKSGTLTTFDCTSLPSCGWDGSNGYNCGTSGGADPSGTYPKACPSLPKDSGTAKGDLPRGDKGTPKDNGLFTPDTVVDAVQGEAGADAGEVLDVAAPARTDKGATPSLSTDESSCSCHVDDRSAAPVSDGSLLLVFAFLLAGAGRGSRRRGR